MYTHICTRAHTQTHIQQNNNNKNKNKNINQSGGKGGSSEGGIGYGYREIIDEYLLILTRAGKTRFLIFGNQSPLLE